MQSCETAVLGSLWDSILLLPTTQGCEAQQVPAEAPEIAGLPQGRGKPEATNYSWLSPPPIIQRFYRTESHLHSQSDLSKKTLTLTYFERYL